MGVLDLFDEYHGDFGLLYERWANEEDRHEFSAEQLRVLSQYVSQLEFYLVKELSDDLRARVQSELDHLEESIDEDVVSILRKRIVRNRRSM